MSDNIDVPVGFTAAQGLGLEPQAQALAAGMAAIEKALHAAALKKGAEGSVRVAADLAKAVDRSAVDEAMALPKAKVVVDEAAINVPPPKAKRHVQRVEVRCLDCGWVQSYGFAASEPREMKRIAFVGDDSRCPRCYARRCVQGGAA